MPSKKASDRKILVVARWPLGGIRTYMRYTFSHFPSDFYIKILAASTQEDRAIESDVLKYKAKLNLVTIKTGSDFPVAVFKELRNDSYDLVISQGFVSAVAVYIANIIFGVPHILTIHGIVEPKYFNGYFGFCKKLFLEFVLSRITVLYGVSKDILEHLYHEYPRLRHNGPQPLVILNGIELTTLDLEEAPKRCLRIELGIEESTFIFGFFGRFMPQKGFDLLIDAVLTLRNENPLVNLAVVAVGSGDYIREYQACVNRKQLDSYFHFLPFQQLVHSLYVQVDAVVMPSRWEACPLLPMEVLCMGTPLIASNCIGLRETIADSPTLVFENEDLGQLVERMRDSLTDNKLKSFVEFRQVARRRFDVTRSACELANFMEKLLEC